jgi:alanyl-tRNA synthetase
MQSNQLRKVRKQFRETKAPADRKHARTTPASLIVNSSEDATTMFNTAGMQPLVPYLMGKEHPTGAKRVYNIQ